MINKYMFPLKVGVLATPSVYAEGALLGGLAGDVVEGQVLFWDRVGSPGGFSAAGLCLAHTRKEPLTQVEKQRFNGLKRSPLGKHWDVPASPAPPRFRIVWQDAVVLKGP